MIVNCAIVLSILSENYTLSVITRLTRHCAWNINLNDIVLHLCYSITDKTRFLTMDEIAFLDYIFGQTCSGCNFYYPNGLCCV